MLRANCQDNRIFFAGEVKNINEMLQQSEVPSTNNNSSVITKPNSTDYTVNNQKISVVTKSIDFSIEEEDTPFLPLNEPSSDEESDDGMEEERLDTREEVPLHSWNENAKVWEIFTPPMKPKKIPKDSEISGITLNVWHSNKWQSQRSKNLINLINKEKVDIICLQEVGEYLLKEIENNDWIREFYCVSDIYGKYLEDFEFGLVILISKDICDHSFKRICELKFENSISKRSSLFLYLAGLTIVNVHLEGLNNERIRIDQINQILNFLGEEDNVLLFGDFSALSGEVKRQSELLESNDFDDLWESLADDDDDGFTFNQDIIADMITSKQRKKKNKIKARFSRIFVKSSSNWRGNQIEIIGNDPIEQCKEKVYISTQFALLVHLTNKPNILLQPPQYESD